MTKLRIAPDLTLPEEAVTSTIVVYGGKGMGKTNFGSVFVEELTKARLRWALLDPMGVAWGLRHSKDGTGPGIECVILGGAHGDIPIEPTGGAIVADLVVDENANVIIDFSRKANGEMWSLSEKVRFVTDYALRLFQRQGELVGGRRREPLMQILDEAARYIPQLIPAGDRLGIAFCVGAWEQVCEEGRNIGLGVTFLTQRSARMNKSVSELADAMVAFRTIGPNSLAAIMDWLGEHVDKARSKELSAQVRELHVGQALVVSPGWLKVERVVHIRARETFDSSATPKPGERQQKVSGAAAKPDLAKYQAKMVATIEKAKADDPKELRKQLAARDARIRQLEKSGGSKVVEKPVADQKAVERAVAVVRREHFAHVAQLRRALEAAMKFVVNINTQNFDVAGADKAELERAITAAVGKATQLIDQRLDARAKHIDAMRQSAQRIAEQLRAVLNDETVVVDVAVARNEPFTVSAPAKRAALARVTARPQSNGAAIGKGERIILIAIAQHQDGVTREQLTVLTGYKRSSRDTYLQRLASGGYVEMDAQSIVATDAGIDALGSEFEPLPTGRALADYWTNRLSGGEQTILGVLLAAEGEVIARETLSETTGYKRSSRDTYLQRLAARKLVVVDREGVRASDLLFDGGER